MSPDQVNVQHLSNHQRARLAAARIVKLLQEIEEWDGRFNEGWEAGQQVSISLQVGNASGLVPSAPALKSESFLSSACPPPFQRSWTRTDETGSGRAVRWSKQVRQGCVRAWRCP
eukprot:746463-Hanusia_phi.AAC.6